jgi:hypothetical protein
MILWLADAPHAESVSRAPCKSLRRGFPTRALDPIRVLARSLALIVLQLAGLESLGCAQSGSTAPSIETIIAHMAQARAENRGRLRPYVVTRDYKLFGKEKIKTKSEVTADVTFVPPGSKVYAIRRHYGTGLGLKVVRRMLDSEAEITTDYGGTDISPRNYDLRLVGEDDSGPGRCYVLELLPRRREKTLLRGKIWVDAGTYLLRRSEGEPASSPSWWLRDVRIAFVYGDVYGMWLQTASEITVSLRLLGPHTMVSQDVSYKVSGLATATSAGEK